MKAFVSALVLAYVGGALPSAAQSAATPAATRPLPLPPGLAGVWRVNGRKVADDASSWSLAAFSTDGKVVGVADEGGTRVYRASDGQLLRMVPAPFSTGQFAYSLAISASGLLALGRVGGLDVFDLSSSAEPLKYHCAGICGPVSALAFSPNGSLLAYQAALSAAEAKTGLVNVVDLRQNARVAELEASATRTGVMFAADGRTLLAANVTRVDGTGTFGLRGWSGGANWRRVRDEAGAQVPAGSIGPYAFDERVAAYALDGRLELREHANGALAWSVPLVPPGLDAVVDGAPMRLELVAFASRGDLVLSYETPASGAAPGTLVFRRMQDGATIAMYDVAGVSSIAVAPDGASFMYSTGAGRTYTVLARVPR
ncbi:MAG TPA: WD40 repeat domain-containing protein [Gammaproteobacteria bacterium]|nr:WD40 repeat domain-containing protein [Gammaproteobacteria bacterium]